MRQHDFTSDSMILKRTGAFVAGAVGPGRGLTVSSRSGGSGTERGSVTRSTSEHRGALDMFSRVRRHAVLRVIDPRSVEGGVARGWDRHGASDGLHIISFRCGLTWRAPSPLPNGFPSPPRVSFPTGDERFAFCGPPVGTREKRQAVVVAITRFNRSSFQQILEQEHDA